MIQYVAPSWLNRSLKSSWNVTEETIRQWQQETVNAIQTNNKIYADRIAEFKSLRAQIVKFFGVSSTVTATIDKYKILKPSDFRQEWQTILKRIAKARKKAETDRQTQIRHTIRVEAGKKAAQTRIKNRREREDYVRDLPSSE